MRHLFLVALILTSAWAMIACTQENEADASTVINTNNELTDKAATDDTATEELPVTTLNWDNETHDFSQIEKGTPVRHTFTFTNTGDSPLVLENVKPSCGCTTPSYSNEPIAPGETGEIVAEFNAKAVGKFTKTLTVTANSNPKVHRIVLKGEVLEN